MFKIVVKIKTLDKNFFKFAENKYLVPFEKF